MCSAYAAGSFAWLPAPLSVRGPYHWVPGRLKEQEVQCKGILVQFAIQILGCLKPWRWRIDYFNLHISEIFTSLGPGLFERREKVRSSRLASFVFEIKSASASRTLTFFGTSTNIFHRSKYLYDRVYGAFQFSFCSHARGVIRAIETSATPTPLQFHLLSNACHKIQSSGTLYDHSSITTQDCHSL